ncbi:FtsX-like permease family protein [Arsenicicoccus sp. MKL-02]|uniref:FtsX-like permease family protein n=1 Tax=Arsenicicoccus cauae TaxID=2663847 RepID=A0A6I3IX06_9MICO|nr:FtsX family ABC transporter permease [Arsenicicoccus cauae]MTB71416.1 FtsX-like permease family protein [Arsenicicoccus cauae]
MIAVRTSISLAASMVHGQARRFVSVLVAITMGIAFVAATFMVGDTFRESLARDAAGSVGRASVVVTTPDGSSGVGGAPRGGPTVVPPGLAAQVTRAHPGASVRTVAGGAVQQDLGGREAPLVLRSVPQLSGTTTLTAGRLPARRGEIAVVDWVASARKLAVGSTTRLLQRGTGTEQRPQEARPTEATVVGIVKAGRDVVPLQGTPAAFALDEDIWAWTGSRGYEELDLTPAPGGSAMDDEQLRASVAGLPAATGLTVRTGEQEKDHRVSVMVQGVTQLTSMLLVFALVAVFVSALVIANTFAILVAQRTRQLALLRCIGAERRQVRGSVVAEALLVGALGSVAGLALGAGLAATLVQLSHGTDLDLGSLVVTPLAVVAPLLTGIVVTLLASLAPARAATRVRPLAALRPETAARVRHVRALRVAVGSVLAAGGGALLGHGALQHQLATGIPGGLLSFLGVLMVAPVVVPGLARVAGALPARLGGAPGELAVDNAGRNPARAAATASALLVGVTLITMMSVGSATGVRSATDALDKQTPVDALVQAPQAPRGIEAHDLDTLRRSSVVEAATLVLDAPATLTHGGRPVGVAAGGGSGGGSGGGQATVTGADDAAVQVSRRPQLFAGLDDHTVLLPASSGLRTGDTVTLAHGAARLDLRADVSADHPDAPVVTAASVRRLDPQAKGSAWIRFAEVKDAATATEQLAQDATTIRGAQVQRVATQRAEMERIMDVVLLVVTGLLGIAVLIALVGIGNTLGLSVLERTQESGLLRALGLTRRQLRSMLCLEALTLAGVGTLVGLALGVAYGLGGAYATFGSEMTITPEIPWARLGLVAAVALAAGWLASVIPARRAARVSPAAALATD